VPIAAHRARLRHLNQSVPASAAGLDLASGASGCAKAQGRHWQVRGRRLQLPSARLALVQFGISATNWALMASAMYLLLGGQVSYLATLGVMLAASIAGVVTPIPAGLGVLEAVYLALLAGSIRQGTLMGGPADVPRALLPGAAGRRTAALRAAGALRLRASAVGGRGCQGAQPTTTSLICITGLRSV